MQEKNTGFLNMYGISIPEEFDFVKEMVLQ